MREARARPRRGGWTCRPVSARRRRVPEVAATGRSIPRGPTAPAGGDSGGSWPAETVRGSGSLAQSPPPTRQAGPVASPGGAPKHLPSPPPTRRHRGVGRAAGAQCPPPSGRGSWRREEGPQDRPRRSTRTLRGRPDLPVAPCLLLRGLESQSQPGVKRAKAYFGSKEGKIFPQGTELPWDCGKSLTLRT